MNDKAVIYIRVSTDKQTEESQLSSCEKLCKDKDWEVINVFREHGKSAYQQVRRPEYDKIIDLAKKRKIKHIVVWALDRWTRRGNKELRAILDYLNKYDVQLHSVREYWIEQLTTSELSFVRDIVLDVLGWIAHQESERISERVKTSKRFQKAKKAGLVGRPTIIQEVEDKVIELLKQGKTYSYIETHVTYKAKHGKIKHVSAPTISSIKKSALEKGLL